MSLHGFNELRRHVVNFLDIPGSGEPVDDVADKGNATGTQTRPSAITAATKDADKNSTGALLTGCTIGISAFCYPILLIVCSSIGIWLAVDDRHNCQIATANITNATTGAPALQTPELAISGFGFGCLLLVIVFLCTFCQNKESVQIGFFVICLLAIVAHTGMLIWGMVLSCTELLYGSCTDKLVIFMCVSGALFLFIIVTLTVSTIVACVRHI